MLQEHQKLTIRGVLSNKKIYLKVISWVDAVYSRFTPPQPECEKTLVEFLKLDMKVPNADKIKFVRIHRLGPIRPGST